MLVLSLPCRWATFLPLLLLVGFSSLPAWAQYRKGNRVHTTVLRPTPADSNQTRPTYLVVVVARNVLPAQPAYRELRLYRGRPTKRHLVQTLFYRTSHDSLWSRTKQYAAQNRRWPWTLRSKTLLGCLRDPIGTTRPAARPGTALPDRRATLVGKTTAPAQFRYTLEDRARASHTPTLQLVFDNTFQVLELSYIYTTFHHDPAKWLPDVSTYTRQP
jgi:hypothetical protein